MNCYSAYLEPYLSGGWNLIGELTGCPDINYGEDDQFGVSTLSLNLGPLQTNMAEPPTHALLPGSIALNYVQDGEAGCGDLVLTDARGFKRRVGGGDTPCDVGAFEEQTRGYLPLIKR
jgi:hypothetical protein